MAGSLPNVFLLFIFICMGQSIGRVLIPQPQSKAPKMPLTLFSKMRNISSTEEFFKSMNMNISQTSASLYKLKSRSSGGISDMIDLDIQTCMVRPYIYFLEQPPHSEAAFIWPHAVKIPRCIGSCNVRHDILACRAKNKSYIPLTTYKVPYHSSRKRRDVMEEFAKLEDPVHELRKRSAGNFKLIGIDLEVHAKCECQCAITKEICAKENKILNEKHCQCECPAVKNCAYPFKWDESQCKCLCGEDPVKKNSDCFRQMNLKGIWNHNKCACECVSTSHCFPQVQQFNVFDAKTCECTCATTKCPQPGQSLIKRRKWCFCK